MTTLPSWLDWLGSPTVCTIVTVVGILTTLLSILFGTQYFKLRLQIQTGQGGPQQQGQGAAQQQQAVQGQITGDTVTINNYNLNFYTETKGDADAGTN